jgi:UDP-3-O-[3-hydroxymyristoyl] glucosamine N-acyltransferase
LSDAREITLSEAAKLIEGSLRGPDATVYGFCSLDVPHPGAIAFVERAGRFNPETTPRPSGLIVPELLDGLDDLGQIVVDNPRLAFVKLMMYFHPPAHVEDNFRHASAVVAEDAAVGEPVHIGPYAVIEPGAVIGAGTFISAQNYIGKDAHIGCDCLIQPGAKILHEVHIGDRCIIGAGSVIGCDGFGYVVKDEEMLKVPQVGTVLIGDDVEIGANCTVDRATLDATLIGDMTKLDNLVQVGHNVRIGNRVRIAAQCGFAGGVSIGDDSVLGGQVGVAPAIHIGKRAMIGARAGVTHTVHDRQAVSGYPAREHRKQLLVEAACNRLPELIKKYERFLSEKGPESDSK